MNNRQPRVVAALPGGGWRVTRTYDDGAVYTTPVVAWLVFEDGGVEPVDTDCSGSVGRLSDESPSGYELTVTHPDEERNDQ